MADDDSKDSNSTTNTSNATNTGEAEKPPVPKSPSQAPGADGPASTFLGLMIWAIAGGLIAWNTDAGQAFLRRYWWAFAGVVAVIAVGLSVPVIAQKLKILSFEARTGLIVFLVLPCLLVLVTGIVLLPEQFQVIAMRGVFLTIVVLLPATMYYLFIVTRKDSLLNEYIAILDRLGLTQPGKLKFHSETSHSDSYLLLLGPRLRLETYLQRFEATYGPIGADSRDQFVETLLRAFDPTARGDADPQLKRRSAVGFTEVFNLATAVPVILATTLFALGWLMVLPPTAPATEGSMVADGLRVSLTPSTGPVAFAFLGAYFFALQTLFRRYVRRDLRASAYVAISIRTMLAVIGTWVMVACVTVLSEGASGVILKPNETLSVIGFVLGVFPQVVWQFVRKVLGKVTFAEVALPSLSSELPLSDLDGLTVWHESRFEEEDIENVANMATADLSDLMLNTRIARGRIIDWVDQAMLYVQIGPKAADAKQPSAREALRAHGIRTATSLLVAYDQSLRRHDDAEFEKLLGGASDGTRQSVRTLVDAIVTSANLDLILTWKGIRRYEVPSLATRLPTTS